MAEADSAVKPKANKVRRGVKGAFMRTLLVRVADVASWLFKRHKESVQASDEHESAHHMNVR
jgi:hypothetical protein